MFGGPVYRELTDVAVPIPRWAAWAPPHAVVVERQLALGLVDHEVVGVLPWRWLAGLYAMTVVARLRSTRFVRYTVLVFPVEVTRT